MGRCGVRISHKLLSKWIVRCGLALRPLYEVMKEKILAEKNIYIDETPVALQASPTCKTAYMRVIVGGQGPNPVYRVYCFKEDRQHDRVLEILQEYRGILQMKLTTNHSPKASSPSPTAKRRISGEEEPERSSAPPFKKPPSTPKRRAFPNSFSGTPYTYWLLSSRIRRLQRIWIFLQKK